MRLFSLVVLCWLFHGCTTVKPYQRQFVNDTEMQMEGGQGFLDYVYSIREGTVPAGTDKSSGGCGCN